jgi:L-fuculose-phosphate aldolase
MMEAKLVQVGVVRSELKSLDECPKQYSEGAPEAVVEIFDEYAEAASTLEVGRDVLIFTWLHEASREYRAVHPRGDKSRPKRGVFDTRSPDRPNPVGLHFARIIAVEGNRITVDRMEVLDGTPVVDIKPAADESPETYDWGRGVTPETARDLDAACKAGWRRGLLSGFNGNVSVRLGRTVVITRSGAAKGHLSPDDLTGIDLDTGETTGPGKASIEAGMHLAVYRARPDASAVFHCHPPHLLALFALDADPVADLQLYEAEAVFSLMTRAPAYEPGSGELARAVGEAAAGHKAVFMEKHGLTCFGSTLTEAGALAEELDSLARIALLARGAGGRPGGE